MKRMKHEKHGFHTAYSPQEEARMREAGWVDDVPTEPAKVVEVVIHTDKPRRGRPAKVAQ
jgi:hypothetical protein